MKTQVAVCPGCGQPVKVDIETKCGICEYCGNQVFLTRDDVMGSEIVQNNMDLAVKYFKEKDINGSVRYAEQVLSYVPDNAIGLFITAFQRSFISATKYKNAMKDFFSKSSATLEMNELKDLLILIKLSLPYLVDCENEVLNFIMSSCNKCTVETFVDNYLPQSIVRHGDSEWLDERTKQTYVRLVANFDVPKTLYALYKSLTENNDSPEFTGNYGMLTVAKDFIERYGGAVTEIMSAIGNLAMKDKFLKATEIKVNAMRKKYEDLYEKIRKYKNS